MAEAVFGGALAQAAASADASTRHTREDEPGMGSRIDGVLTGYGIRKAGGRRGRSENSELVRSADLLHPLAFSGIHVISPRLLPMIAEEGVFSIINSYLNLTARGQKMLAFRADEYYWRDLGRPADLIRAAEDLKTV